MLHHEAPELLARHIVAYDDRIGVVRHERA
jgi:hypothetical protein